MKLPCGKAYPRVYTRLNDHKMPVSMRLFGLKVFHPLSKRQWRSAILLFVAYVAATRVSAALFMAPGLLFPASGIAMGALFLEGVALWPIVFLASLTGYVLSGSSLVYLLILPIAHTLQAVVGAWILKQLGLDPLFRRMKDMIALIAVSLVAGLIVPTLGTAAHYLNSYVYDVPLSDVTWGSWYAATVFSLLVISPFVIRWFAKPRFSRNTMQTLEVLGAFGLLSVICYFLFLTSHTSIAGISLVYLMLIPLFWIALRLRPRFTTLALLVLSAFAFTAIFTGGVPADQMGVRMYQTELFLCIIAAIFFILTSLEEDRRVITNLMRSQVATLQTALERVAGQDRAKSEFIAMLAHELRNPLAPIASSIDLLRLKGPQDPEKTEVLDLMENRMQTVRRLLDDLLDASRITENKLTLEKEEVEIADIVKRASGSAEHYFKERDQRLVVEMPAEVLIIEADPVRIEQVVTNLLTNASKFSNPRDEIRLAVRVNANMVELSVSDKGVGIEKEMLGRIFDPFLQVELGKRTRQGLGIGLALVRSLTEMHGGTVRAKSEGRGHGSQFTIILPLARRTARRVERKEAPTPQNATGNGKRILVVDDNDAAAWGIGRLLELKGYSIDYAYDGEQALDTARSFSPNAIFLDIGLPDMDGHEVAAKLRASGYTGILIALTGYSMGEAEGGGNFDVHLVKPVGLADLTRALEKLG